MDNEVKRFFDSIKFSSDLFNGVTVKKVIYNKNKQSYNVNLLCPNIIEKSEIDRLFLACNNKIKGEKVCFVSLEYLNKDPLELEKYINEVIKSFYENKPSMQDIKIKYDGVITILVSFPIELKIIESDLKQIHNILKQYGVDTEIKIILDEEVTKKVKAEIDLENTSEIKVKKSPMVMGYHVDGEVTKFIDINSEVSNKIFEVYIFGIETLERKGKKGPFYINNIKVSDKTDSYLMKIVKFDLEENNNIMSKLKEGIWIRVFGSIDMDDYLHMFILNPKSIEIIDSKDESIIDDALVKRVELHAHTMMSQMDGITKIDLSKHTSQLVTNAINMGYKAVAITDHNGCQAFPIAYQLISGHNKKIEDKSKHFKGLYGVELTLVDDTVAIVKDPIDADLKNSCYVVFDTETTGFNAASGDVMIEIGAVKLEGGVIVDRFDEFINPGFHIPDNITALTEITDDMVASADNEETVVNRPVCIR